MIIFLNVEETKDDDGQVVSTRTTADISVRLGGPYSIPVMQEFKKELEAFCDGWLNRAIIKRITYRGA